MPGISDAALLINEWTDEMEIPDLGFKVAGICTLVFDNTLFVEIEYDDTNHSLRFTTQIGQPEDKKKTTLLENCLKTNYFFSEMGGNFIGISPEGGELVLINNFNLAQADYPSFCQHLEHFIKSADAWIKMIQDQENIKEDTNLDEQINQLRVDPTSMA